MSLFKIINACYEEEQIWCTMFHDPYLYKMDFASRQITSVAPILDEKEDLGAFIFILPYNDAFVFVSSATNNLILMGRNSFSKKKYRIPTFKYSDLRLSKFFANGFIFNDVLYFWGLDYRGVIKFDFLNERFSIIDDFLAEVKIKNHNENFYYNDYIHFADKLYLPFVNSNAVLELSLSDDSTEIHYVGDDKQRFISGAFDGESIWLAPRDAVNGDIVKWSLQNDSVKQYKSPFRENKRIAKYSFDKAVKIGNYILILSMRSKNGNLKINVDTEEITQLDDFFKAYFHFGSKYPCINVKDDVLFCIDEFDLIKYDLLAGGKVETTSFVPSDSVLRRLECSETEKIRFVFQPKRNGHSPVINEQRKFNLHHLIEFLKRQ